MGVRINFEGGKCMDNTIYVKDGWKDLGDIIRLLEDYKELADRNIETLEKELEEANEHIEELESKNEELQVKIEELEVEP
jgi:chromosome segregation ATPase